MSNLENFCLFFIQHWSTCLQKSEWAAWAQAFFSVLAIFFSVRMVRQQHANQLKGIRYEHDLQSQKEAERLNSARLAWLAAVEHEIKSCAKQCEIYVVQFFESGLSSPKYRLSRLAHDGALASLVADGTLTESATDAIKQFYTDADSFNRCLDKVEELWLIASTDRAPPDSLGVAIRSEADRAVVKALHLVAKDAATRNVAPPSYQTVVSRLEPALNAIEDTRQELKRTPPTAA